MGAPSGLRDRLPRDATVASAEQTVRLVHGPVGVYVPLSFCARACPFSPWKKAVSRPGLPECCADTLRLNRGR